MIGFSTVAALRQIIYAIWKKSKIFASPKHEMTRKISGPYLFCAICTSSMNECSEALWKTRRSSNFEFKQESVAVLFSSRVEETTPHSTCKELEKMPHLKACPYKTNATESQL